MQEARAQRGGGGEWPRSAIWAGGAVCAVLLVGWMAAGAAVSPTVPDAMDGRCQAREQPQRERGEANGSRRQVPGGGARVFVGFDHFGDK